jgi:hypothetical protein
MIKLANPTVGMDIAGIINKMYPTINEQHDFMYTKMIPTMQKVLGEIRDLVTTAPKRAVLETLYEMHPTLSPRTNAPFNWVDYYKYISIDGLDKTSCFKEHYPDPSDALRLFHDYITAGKIELDR